MQNDHLNTHLPKPLAAHVAALAGPGGLFDNPDEYIRDLIRRDMHARDIQAATQAIAEGYDDIAAGRYVKSTGNIEADLSLLAEKENTAWK